MSATSWQEPCRIAFIFVGHARTFIKPAVYESIRRELVEGFSQGCDRDVFWYLSAAPKWSISANATLYSMFQPTKVVVADDEAETEWAAPCLEPPLPRLTELKVPATFKFFDDPPAAVRIARALFGRMAQAFKLVEDRERETHITYSWVVRARFDAGWYAPMGVAATDLAQDRIYVPIQTWNGINDQFALVPRQFALDYFNAQDVLECDESTGYPLWYASPTHVWQPETLLWRHLQLRGVPVARRTLPVIISRFDGTSRCLEVAPHTLLGTVADAIARPIVETSLFSRISKTAHIAACAARYACCSLDLHLDGRIIDLDVAPFGDLESACRNHGFSRDTCSLLHTELRKHSLRADDASLVEDLTKLVDLIQNLRHRIDDRTSLVQITGPPIREDLRSMMTSSAADAAKGAVWSGWLSVTPQAKVDLWHSLLCAYLWLWPRAEAVAARREEKLAPIVNYGNCTGLVEHLAYTESWLHSHVDDTKLTYPDYATLSSHYLGWQVWTIPEFPRSIDPYGVPELPALDFWHNMPASCSR